MGTIQGKRPCTMGKNQDRIVGIVILLIGGFLFWETFSFRKAEWEPLGMAFWPRIILVMMGIIGVYYTIRGSVDKGPYQKVDPRAFLILLGGIVYVLLLNLLGFLIITPVFIFSFSILLGGTNRSNIIRAVCTAVICTIGVYLVFQKGLLIQLPEGILG